MDSNTQSSVNDFQQDAIRVLLIEDDEGDAFLIRELLEDVDATITIRHVERLSTGIDLVSSDSVDIILLDLSLPDSSGLDTMLHMRAAEIDVPIIVLSGLDDEKSKMDSVKAGAQDFFVKGKVEGESLIRGIRYAIERKRILSERERLIDELQAARDNIKVLTGLLPVCMQCKKIRDDKGYWSQMEVYIEANSEADFTHGICDECKETVIKGIRKNH